MPETVETQYLIIGAGIAGIAAAEAIRDANSYGPMIIVNGEKHPPYCRPLIIELLTGERTLDGIALRDQSWYKSNRIDLLNGERVVSIDARSRSVKTNADKIITYEKLLIAPGSIPTRPPIAGLGDVAAFNLYRTDDVESMIPLCVPGARVLIIGIGLIGLQAIIAMRKLKLDVTAVEMMPKVLPLILDREGAKYAHKKLEKNGVKVHTGAAITEVAESNNGAGRYTATTDKGNVIPFDFAVLSTGMKPDISWLAGSGIDTGAGIIVSHTMETSVSGIFAAGDAVQYHDWIEGRPEIHAHWVNAYRQGRIAGLTMAGSESVGYEPIYLNSLSVFGLPIITMGESRVDDPADAETFVTEIPARQIYTRFVVRDRNLVGATFINDIDRAGVLQYLISEKIDIGDTAPTLLDEGRQGLEFLYSIHRDAIKGDIEWPETMDLIDKYRKDMNRTRWGGT